MGRPRGWAAARAGRPAMRSPGRPPVARREDRQRFWVAIARGMPSEDAGIEAGVSPAVGTRWFRDSGGIRLVSLAPLSGRYLSLAEREEIAILRVRGCGVREIARRTGRSPSTISRELRRTPRPGAAGGVPGDAASGTRTGGHGARRSRSSLRARPCGSTCETGSPDDHQARWRGCGGPCALDRAPARSPGGPALGQVVEPGADREPVVLIDFPDDESMRVCARGDAPRPCMSRAAAGCGAS